MHTYHIHITGIVQGVGFRPFVYKMANGLGLKGYIKNGLDGVHFEFNANEVLANKVYKSILKEAPSNARIYSHSLSQVNNTRFNTLEIVRSDELGEPDIPLTPDFALCPDCRKELETSSNRRFNYPFITCTYCGPRYSITNKLPYDRHTTTMSEFKMCPNCQSEYDNPLDRRYYSQTNSCEVCGIKVSFFDSSTEKITSNVKDPNHYINLTVDYIKKGKIIAVKGVGGYLLICDATNVKAINKLRAKKHRPSKPFAVMYPNIELLSNEFKINQQEKSELTNEVGAIVLLQKKESNSSLLQTEIIAPGLSRIGCMIPYAPLYQLILNQFPTPIIATSANVSGSPIIYNDATAMEELASIADGILMHNRAILIPQDDSVVSFTAQHNQPIIHRRSRGLAPTYDTQLFKATDKTILATGAQMKSSFTVLTKNRVYISQYLGDMDNYLTQLAYDHTINHLQSILVCEPQIIICDKHPSYFTTQWANEKSQELNLPLHQIQHHKAHFAAVLAEHSLLQASESILGVIWDGTGMGDDGQIWGGEFFTYQNYKMDRIDHIGYFPFILGDKMPKEPRISALSICHEVGDYKEILQSKFTNQEWDLYQKILNNKANQLSTSSMGRLFDAVASLLLNINKTTYEGEAAMQLENLAKSFNPPEPVDFSNSYFRTIKELPKNKAAYLINAILSDLKKGIKPDQIAYFFHISLVDLVRLIATKNNLQNIAFSGGVFQNELLVDMIISLLNSDFKLYFHQQLSPNDENISLGQLVSYALIK